LLDLNFIEGPSLDFWVNNELIEERLFPNLDVTLKALRSALPGYLNPPKLD
jgi:hypothetical protein